MPEASEPQKTILFAPAWFPNKFDSGSGIFNREIARLLATRYRVVVVYIHFHEFPSEGTHLEIDKAEGIDVIRYYVHRRMHSPSLFPLLYTHYFMKAYHYYFNRRNPNLVFVRGVLPAGMGAWTVTGRRHVPYVTTESFSGFPEAMASRPRRLAAWRILSRARLNSAVSSYQRDVMLRFFPRASIEVVPNVIAPEPFAEGAPPPLAERLRMLYVGNLVPVKGWDVLLEAYRLFLDRERRPASLTIVGGGDTSALERKLRELEIEPDVDYLGRRPHDEVKRLMREHHFLVLPSRVDTCPNVVLESMMQGRPVLATRSGGAEDLLDSSTGILVQKESAPALAEGMTQMVNDYERFIEADIHEKAVRDHGPERLFAFLERGMRGG